MLTFEVSDLTNASYCLQGLAEVAEAQGEPRRAARLLGAAEALLEAVGTHHYAQMDHELYERVADATRERLGEPAWTAARREGRAMSFDEVAYVRQGGRLLKREPRHLPQSNRTRFVDAFEIRGVLISAVVTAITPLVPGFDMIAVPPFKAT